MATREPYVPRRPGTTAGHQPASPTQAQRPGPRATVEYRQMTAPAADGKFEWLLNAHAAEGWEVQSINLFEGTYLVTFVRRLPVRKRVTTTETARHEDIR